MFQAVRNIGAYPSEESYGALSNEITETSNNKMIVF